MAVALQKVEIVKEGDANIGCVTDVVIDTEAGIVAEKKRFAIEVPDGRGGVAVLCGEAVKARKIVSL